MKKGVAFLLAAGLALAVAAPASATPPSSDTKTDAQDAAAWLAHQVNASGFIPSATNPSLPNYSESAQAVTALVSAGVGRTTVAALLAYLGGHVDDFVASPGSDDPGDLAYLILAAKAGGQDPASFGSAHVDLVARLEATQQASGLFGASDPTFDGAFRQGLSLLALHSAGATNTAGVTWLESQQCVDGSWTAFRADTSVACAPVDPATFSGPDTNSTALAVTGLQAQGDSTAASKGVTALDAVRNAGGGWGFLSRGDQATDANSTGLVLAALRTATGHVDGPGLSALLALQVGCTGPVADRGGIAFQPGTGGKLVPDAFATVQAIPAVARVELPVAASATTPGVPTPCAAPVTTTVPETGTTVRDTGTTVRDTGSTDATTVAPETVAAEAELPRTGSSSAPVAFVGVLILAVGAAFVAGARRRR